MTGTATLRIGFAAGPPLGLSKRPAETGGPDGPTDPESRVDVWRKRIRFRRHLARLLRINPGLIADIGLTVQEAEKEIEKSFWAE